MRCGVIYAALLRRTIVSGAGRCKPAREVTGRLSDFWRSFMVERSMSTMSGEGGRQHVPVLGANAVERRTDVIHPGI